MSEQEASTIEAKISKLFKLLKSIVKLSLNI